MSRELFILSGAGLTAWFGAQGTLPATWGDQSSFASVRTMNFINNNLSGPIPATWQVDATGKPRFGNLQSLFLSPGAAPSLILAAFLSPYICLWSCACSAGTAFFTPRQSLCPAPSRELRIEGPLCMGMYRVYGHVTKGQQAPTLFGVTSDRAVWCGACSGNTGMCGLTPQGVPVFQKIGFLDPVQVRRTCIMGSSRTDVHY